MDKINMSKNKQKDLEDRHENGIKTKRGPPVIDNKKEKSFMLQ